MAYVTTKVRGIGTEIHLGGEEGLTKPCVVNVDVINTVDKRKLLKKIGELSSQKMHLLDEALIFALGLPSR